MNNIENLRKLAENSKAWPFVEARKILKKINNKTPEKGYVLFETGYGPSGLPHIGTFGEVSRTSMVMYAFKILSDIPTKLIVFSDDMDGFRKVPGNVPNQELLQKALGMPLTSVPDPFEKYASFGEHNNEMLKRFLDEFGFEYEYYSSTECYKKGLFDKELMLVLKHYKEVCDVVLPTLGEERKQTYSPFLPICKKTGKVLQTEVIETNFEKGEITYLDEDREKVTTKVTGGSCKLQWKVDWAMRWAALNVDYEMSGKDLIPSVELSTKICKILCQRAPISFTYELFLDKKGEKISKSKGNGISMDDWLRYANNESLSYFMYQKPQTAKRLYFDVIPKSVDEWLNSIVKYEKLTEEQKLTNPVFFMYKNNPPKNIEDISFSLVMNLVSVLNTDDKDVILGFINQYGQYNKETEAVLLSLISYAINYFEDFVKPTLSYRSPNDTELALIQKLHSSLLEIKDTNPSANDIQKVVYSIGKESDLEMKDWFKCLYEVLLGQSQGPRMGSFFALYGISNSIKLIEKVLNTN